MFSFAIAGVLGYLLGSLPTAFLLVHWKSSLDIRSTGSGNVGTLNSYQVTGSFVVGACVLLLDAAKGIAAVSIAWALPDHDFARQACAGVFAVIGHNFPVWLRFRGGRGLATAAGVFAMFCWPLILLWGALWGVAYIFLGEVNPANAAASIIMPVIALAVPGALSSFAAPGIRGGDLAGAAALAMLVVLVKLVEPVLAYIKEKRAASDRTDQGSGTS